MRFTVRWLAEAEEALAQIWMDADPDERGAISASVQKIDELLSRSPGQCGESRDEDRRICFALPLAIEFEILIPDQTVHITRLWPIRKR